MTRLSAFSAFILGSVEVLFGELYYSDTELVCTRPVHGKLPSITLTRNLGIT